MQQRPKLQEKYITETTPKLKEEFGYRNLLEVPRLIKTVVNVGIGRGLKEAGMTEIVEKTLRKITGQKPVPTQAKKSISGFKIRKGMVVGMKVTLRGRRMYEFLDKMINISFPRVRDFRGIPLSCIDGRGNLTVGFGEHLVFGEISTDEIEKVHGLEVCVNTNAKTREEGMRLLHLLGFPFQSE